MLHPAWQTRAAPLAQCPLPACRRSGICRHPTDADPCRRLHQRLEAMRSALADKFEHMAAEARRRDPHGHNRAPQGSPEFERRHKDLYDALRAADEANSAREMAERRKRQKPATPPSAG